MSKENVKQMFKKMEKDAELQKKYASLLQAHQKDTEKMLSDRLIELGKASGWAFSKDDLLAARAETMDKANANKELSDSDLSNVAGGMNGCQKATYLIASIGSLGIACGVASIIIEAVKSSCGESLSASKC